MIRPPSASRVAACWQAKNVPFTLIAKIRSNSSSVTALTGFVNMVPALFTRMSIFPKRARVSSKSRVIRHTPHIGPDGKRLSAGCLNFAHQFLRRRRLG